ncbi:hypothetical protein FRC07_003502 [Ceratobasidium sp. 392]|nr:hypothetical protein FRC07_003502 [Ceratobasidium sp. 392]
MFKFDFNIEDGENHTVTEDPSNGRPHSTKPPDVDNRPLVELRLVDMLEALPYDMSYSSIHTGSLRIPRRDLFDVRMRLMTLEAQTERENQSMKVASDADAAIEFASRPSDLVPRVYEGGLKTWECSLDLADYIVNSQAQIEDLRGKRIIEVVEPPCRPCRLSKNS